ncbi:MAG: AbrB/MazE/SpoVT family DNA-binding domain-containing protein [Nitrospirota bacterium]|jgi:antitoxin MazE
MSEKMKTNLVSIGNAKGIKIPPVILRQCNIEDHVELEVEDNRIVIKPVKGKPREGWNKAFKLMHMRKEDIPLIDEKADIDMEDWEWK